MKYIIHSDTLSVNQTTPWRKDKINLIYQYFIHNNDARCKELDFCLHQNVKNPLIDKIYLLNERIYTNNELGIQSDKIIQYDIKDRLTFKTVFEFINEENLKGYCVIANGDIIFDNTLSNLFYTDLYDNKSMFSQFNIDVWSHSFKF